MNSTNIITVFCRFSRREVRELSTFSRASEQLMLTRNRRLLRCVPHTRLDERPQSSQQRKKSLAKCRRLLPTYRLHPSPSSLTLTNLPEIGHEKAQSVIDSITSSYAAEGQSSSNPMLGQNPGLNPPPPFAFPGGTSSPSPPFQTLLTHLVGVPPPPFGMPGMPPIPGMPLPGGLPIPPPGGRGMPMPPFPGGPMPPLPQGMQFPPPGGLPPNFQFPPLPGGFQPPPGFPPLPGAPGFDAQNQGQQGGQGQGQGQNDRR